jgi:cell division protein FtsQ
VVRAIALGLALGAGVALGALRGEALLARALPERAAQLRLAVLGNAEAAPLELAAAAGVGPGSRLAALDLDAVAAGVAKHPWVASARVAALPPDWLLVAVEERTPVAVAHVGAEAWLVDAGGTAFVAAAEGAALPALLGAESREDPRLAEGVAWLAALGAHGLPAPRALQVAGADATRAPALALTSDAPAPDALVLLGAGERDAKLARLAKLFAVRPPELANAAEIDLRFGADVILRPRPPKPAAGAELSQRAETNERAG